MNAKILKDSINANTDDRLLTYQVKFPRFVNAEILRHRMLSFNSASSRAIPVAKMIASVLDDPAMPVFVGKAQAGMQAHEEVDEATKKQFLKEWLELRDHVAQVVSHWAQDLKIHKQLANRPLEFAQNITLLISGTEWGNYFALRDEKDTQPELKDLAHEMLELYNASNPTIKLPHDSRGFDDTVIDRNDVCIYNFIENTEDFYTTRQWHIPFEERMPDGLSFLQMLKIAIARCARTSYVSFDGTIKPEDDYALYDSLVSGKPKHMSPCEHIAYPLMESKFVGNFKGWLQYRKLILQENAVDPRAIKKRVKNGEIVW